VNLPVITDPTLQGTFDVISTVQVAAQFFNDNLHCLMICRTVNLSLEHGNCDASSYAYVMFGMILGPRFNDYKKGFAFGNLALSLIEKHELGRFNARVLMVFGQIVSPWTEHVRIGRQFMQRAAIVAQERGDLAFETFSRINLVANRFLCGDPLEELQQEAEQALAFVIKVDSKPAYITITAMCKLITNLRGLQPKFGSFNDSAFDEARFEANMEGYAKHSMTAIFYWIRKLQVRFIANQFSAALESAASAESLLWTSPSFIQLCEFHFYAAMARAVHCSGAPLEQQAALRRSLLSHQENLAFWAANCPANFGSRAALIAAEIARLDGRTLDAERLYEEAVRSAQEHGFIQLEGIAHEAAARFYAARGFHTIADAYLENARSCYLRWGADAKVRQLDLDHPHLAPQTAPLGTSSTIGAQIEQLDLATVVKVSQAVAGEIEFERLIDTLMKTALEHAGGERGLLILPRGDEMWIEAEAVISRDTIVVGRPNVPVSGAQLPQSVYHYVLRTRDSKLLDDASTQDPFSADKYVRRNRSRSILCLPLIKQTQLVGVLYLENALASHVFTSARIALLKLVASQSATSLENARLYSELRDADASLTQAQRLSQTGSFSWSPSSGKIYWSDETFRIFECDRGTQPSFDSIIEQRIHPDDAATFRQFIERVSHDGRDYTHAYRLRMPDGRIKYMNVVARAARSETGNIEYFGAVMDVTGQQLALVERDRLEQRLRQAEKMEAVGRLASGIAHDFNGVLANVLTYGEMVFNKVPAKSRLKRHAQGVLTAANVGRDLVGQILEYSGARRGRLAPVDVADVAAGSLELLRGSLPAKIHLDWTAPQAPLVVNGDATRLHRVLTNLCSNAIQAMNGGGTLRVALDIAEFAGDQALSHGTLGRGRYVRIIVADTGCGMEKATLARIFEPFFTTKELGLGTGLGLSLVYTIVSETTGAIDVKSIPGQGSTFTVYIPNSDLPSSQGEKVTYDASQHGGLSDGGRPKLHL
jgi:signal transduction histidine kinase/GAF domain-containing protein